MALLRKSASQKTQVGTTVLSQGATFVGDLTLEGPLHIDGTYEGDINSSSDVVIGAAGHFEGKLRAQRILVSGNATGTFQCGRLEIVASGKLTGDVLSKEFVIEPGGRFIGGSRSLGEEPQAALSQLEENRAAGKSGRDEAAAELVDAELQAEPEPNA